MKSLPQTQVILIASEQTNCDAYQAIKAGAKALIPYHVEAAEIRRAILCVHEGEIVIGADMALKMINEVRQLRGTLKVKEKNHELGLTNRELEILRLICKGYTNSDIARTLFISKNTVKVHLGHILEKMNVHTRLQAAAYAFEQLEHYILSEESLQENSH